MPAGIDEIYKSIRFDLDGVAFSKWPKLSCSAANELTLATPDDPNSGVARLAIDGALKLQAGMAVNQFSGDSTLAGNSDLTVPTEKAVKAYIDTQIAHVNQALSAKAALAGTSSQDFQAKNLTVSGSITTAGNVGIGTPSPGAKLDINGRTFYRDGLDFGDTAADGYGKVGMISWGSEPSKFVVFGRAGWGLGLGANGRGTDICIGTSGYVGIGTANPQYPLHLSSGAYCTGTKWEDASSIEYKEDVVPLTLDKALETLANLSPVTFRYKVEEDKKHVGFIAEEVPDLVASKDRKGLSSMDIVGILTKVVQHQQKEIEELKARLNEGQ